MLGQPPECGVAVLDGSRVWVLGRNAIVDDEHRYPGRGDIPTDGEVAHRADVFEAEDHAAAMDEKHRAAGLLHCRPPIPRRFQRCAVICGQGKAFGVDTPGG